MNPTLPERDATERPLNATEATDVRVVRALLAYGPHLSAAIRADEYVRADEADKPDVRIDRNPLPAELVAAALAERTTR